MRNQFFCLLDRQDRAMVFTIRPFRRDVPAASEVWSGYTYAQLRKWGYRIAKVIVSEVQKP